MSIAKSLPQLFGDPRKARSFIEAVDDGELLLRFNGVRTNCDHYPHHFLMHLIHCCEVIGYKHPDADVRTVWNAFYQSFCVGLHVNPESEAQMDARLDAPEEQFVPCCDGPVQGLASI